MQEIGSICTKLGKMIDLQGSCSVLVRPVASLKMPKVGRSSSGVSRKEAAIVWILLSLN